MQSVWYRHDQQKVVDALRRGERLSVRSLYDAGLVRGQVYAIDGTGLSNDYRLVCLVCVSAERPKIVAWRLRNHFVTKAKLVRQADARRGCVQLVVKVRSVLANLRQAAPRNRG